MLEPFSKRAVERRRDSQRGCPRRVWLCRETAHPYWRMGYDRDGLDSREDS